MATAEAVLALAAGEIGVEEEPSGSNRVKYNTEYYGSEVSGAAYSWCCVFIWWLFRQAASAALYYGGKKTASCTTLMEYYRRLGQTVTSGFRAGDLVVYDFSGEKKLAVHIGIVESVLPDGRLVTIEGNTSPQNDTSGGKVQRRIRSTDFVTAGIRPAYEEVEDLTREETIALFGQLWEEKNPVYAALDDVPAGWKAEVKRLVELDCINGGTPAEVNATDLNIDQSTLKAAIIAKRYADRILPKE